MVTRYVYVATEGTRQQFLTLGKKLHMCGSNLSVHIHLCIFDVFVGSGDGSTEVNRLAGDHRQKLLHVWLEMTRFRNPCGLASGFT